ncbi:chaplin [Streptomyces griseiscabiei]|uniref:chaplin n=1 Tax=Streptomyces griseiscabiei TaxID=2993540 RepID=UPI003872FF28
MKNLKKAAAVTMVAGGLVAAGAGMASASDGGDEATGHHRDSGGLLQVLHFEPFLAVAAAVARSTH